MLQYKGKSMCFTSAKGGVGKTINLLNLAGIFEQLEKKVLIIDFDLCGGAVGLYLNKFNEKNIYNMYFDMTTNNYRNINDYTVRLDDYIDVLCAPIDPRYANKIDSNYVREIINSGKLNYDVVLVDTNHDLNEIKLSVLEAVDQIMFMVSNDPLDLKNLRSLLSILDSLDFKNYSILLNNSRDPFKNYFSIYEMRKILGHDIDYTLSSDLYLKEIDKYVMRGLIVSLYKDFPNIMTEDYKTFVLMATDLLERTSVEHE